MPGARDRAERGELAFGTIDSFLLWRLTDGKVHASDATNASRTLLLNIHTGAWDDEMLRLFRVPRALLPEVKDCAAEFGTAEAALFGAPLPILGMAGDQQAATVGGCLLQAGDDEIDLWHRLLCPAQHRADAGSLEDNRLLTTIAYVLLDGKRTYALEGSIFIAGAAVQWLRDGLGIIESAGQSGALAA